MPLSPSVSVPTALFFFFFLTCQLLFILQDPGPMLPLSGSLPDILSLCGVFISPSELPQRSVRAQSRRHTLLTNVSEFLLVPARDGKQT